jgi:hypothetical protein
MITDQQELFLFIGVVAFIVNLWILSEIIKGATKSARNIALQEAQVLLLTSIALKLGVSNEDVLKDTKELKWIISPAAKSQN